MGTRRKYKTRNNDVRKGIWIEIELIKNVELDWTNKALLTEIQSLNEKEKGCIASNEFFGNLLGIGKSSASKRITQLKDLGYIRTVNKYEKGNCIGRVITPTFKKSKSDMQHPEPIEGSSLKNQEVVPYLIDGSSRTTKEVVPETTEGSSYTNTINTTTNSIELMQDNNTGFNEIEIENSINGKNKITSDAGINVDRLGYEAEFPEEFFSVLDKKYNSGWNSLSVPEAALYWKYKYSFIKLLDSKPEINDFELL